MNSALYPFFVFFLLFFFWLAYQVMHPRQPNAPKVPAYKIVLLVTVLVASVSLGVCLWLRLADPISLDTTDKVPLVKPRVLMPTPAAEGDA